MTKAILSFDYDDCSEIAFLKVPDDASPLYKARVALAQKTFTDYLDEIAKTHDEVEVYVGSTRQDISLDNFFMQQHENGSCFQNLEKLCAQRGWTFRRLLLADVQNNYPAGTAMNNEDVKCRSCDDFKLEIVKAQIDDVKENHPDESVDFYFFDDDMNNQYIPSINNHFKNNLPEHINKLSLVKYDLAETVNEGRPALMSETHITQPRIKQSIVKETKSIRSVESTIIKFGLFDNFEDAIKNKRALAQFSPENVKRVREDNVMSERMKRMKR